MVTQCIDKKSIVLSNLEILRSVLTIFYFIYQLPTNMFLLFKLQRICKHSKSI